MSDLRSDAYTRIIAAARASEQIETELIAATDLIRINRRKKLGVLMLPADTQDHVMLAMRKLDKALTILTKTHWPSSTDFEQASAPRE